jgi:hypothetical protein
MGDSSVCGHPRLVHDRYYGTRRGGVCCASCASAFAAFHFLGSMAEMEPTKPVSVHRRRLGIGHDFREVLPVDARLCGGFCDLRIHLHRAQESWPLARKGSAGRVTHSAIVAGPRRSRLEVGRGTGEPGRASLAGCRRARRGGSRGRWLPRGGRCPMPSAGQY